MHYLFFTSINNVLLHHLKREMTVNPFCSQKNDGSYTPFCIIPSLFACGYSCANTMQHLSPEVCKILAPMIAFKLRLLFDRFSKQYCAQSYLCVLGSRLSVNSSKETLSKGKVQFCQEPDKARVIKQTRALWVINKLSFLWGSANALGEQEDKILNLLKIWVCVYLLPFSWVWDCVLEVFFHIKNQSVYCVILWKKNYHKIKYTCPPCSCFQFYSENRFTEIM